MAEKIAVAMSGGVDSSVSAFLLKKSGFNVVGVTFLLFESKNFKVALSDAKKVSDSIGIEHIIVDLRKEFRNEVINYFISEYLSGRTPNPCIMCNKNIKFGLAMTKLLNMGFSKIATGHYSQIIKQNERFAVKKNRSNKDQSYCFCLLNQEQLGRIITPVSCFSKDKVRKIAKENNIPVWDKSDSQDICFINGSYKKFLSDFGIKDIPGNFVDEAGNILGKHRGIFNYTVGQRRGIDISVGKRIYVKKINPKSNEIILSERFAVKKITIGDINFVSFGRENLPKIMDVCVRYNSETISAKIELKNTRNAEIEFSAPMFNVCPGQFAVCYHKNYLAIGGVIEKIFY